MPLLEPKVYPYRILSLDGGGIRGAFQAVVIERLVREMPTLIPSVSLFAGTSIGGINAMLLASGIAATDLVQLYKDYGRKIFDKSWFDDIKDLGKLVGAGFSQDNLEAVLTNYFGTRTLDTLQRRVIVPAFQLDTGANSNPRTWKMKFFHNFPGTDSDGSQKIVDVALRTSAGPTYFPTYQGYVDGGIGCNNPSMAAVSAAINPLVGCQDLSAVNVLSISAGANPSWVEGQTHNWGYAQWAIPLSMIMVDANVGIADYHCQQILGGRSYCRLDPILPRRVDNTDAGSLDDLMAWAADIDISPTVAWLKAGAFSL